MPDRLPAACRVSTLVLAGGSGERYGGRKQFQLVAGRRLIDVAVAAAEAAGHRVIRVVPAADVDTERACHPGAVVVAGGSTRSASVRAGLGALDDDVEVVCVHDAVRPLATPALFAAVVGAVLGGADGAVPAMAVTDTIKVIDDPAVELPEVIDTPDRARLVVVQTPQAFRLDVLRAAHAGSDDATDDAALVERHGGRVVVVPGEGTNRKVTVAGDLAWAESELAGRTARPWV